jgi:hypothetical protein
MRFLAPRPSSADPVSDALRCRAQRSESSPLALPVGVISAAAAAMANPLVAEAAVTPSLK